MSPESLDALPAPLRAGNGHGRRRCWGRRHRRSSHSATSCVGGLRVVLHGADPCHAIVRACTARHSVATPIRRREVACFGVACCEPSVLPRRRPVGYPTEGVRLGPRSRLPCQPELLCLIMPIDIPAHGCWIVASTCASISGRGHSIKGRDIVAVAISQASQS